MTARLLEERKSGIGGSDAAPILGLSRFRTAMDVYAEKIGLSAPLVETEAMEWGKRLEAVVAKAWAEKTGHKIHSDTRVRRHPEHRWMIAHVDRWLDDEDALLEVKTTNQWASSEWGEEDTDQVPAEYRLQIAHYMAVTGRARCYVAVLISGYRFRKYVVDRDLEIEVPLIDREATFWQDHVLARVPPDIDWSESSRDYLLARYPKVEIEEIPEPEGFEALALEHLRIDATVKELERRRDEVRNLMTDRMGVAGAVTGSAYRATWSNVKTPAKTDWPAVAAEAAVPAAVIEKHTKPAGSTRRFVVKEREDVA